MKSAILLHINVKYRTQLWSNDTLIEQDSGLKRRSHPSFTVIRNISTLSRLHPIDFIYLTCASAIFYIFSAATTVAFFFMRTVSN